MRVPNISSSYKLQFASNLQVHKLPLKQSSQLLSPVSHNLALLGDIGLPKCRKTQDFFKWCESIYDTIYWVPGYLELSDSEGKKHTWLERLNACNESIESWNLKKTVLCSKQSVYIHEPNLQLLLTPLWNQIPTNIINTNMSNHIYVKSSNGSITPLSKKGYMELRTSELDWLLTRTAYSSVPVAWLTYSSPFNISSEIDPAFDLLPLDHPKLICSLRGRNTGINKSPMGNSVNIKGSSSFSIDSYWEYVDNKSDMLNNDEDKIIDILRRF